MVPGNGSADESACCERSPLAISLRRNSQYVAVRYERSPFSTPHVPVLRDSVLGCHTPREQPADRINRAAVSNAQIWRVRIRVNVQPSCLNTPSTVKRCSGSAVNSPHISSFADFDRVEGADLK